MSNTVDQRIVQMQFDNAQFEKGIAVTMASLKKFDKELQLKEGVTGIKNIDAAISKVDFQGMSSALDDINGKFSILGVAGATAVSRVTNKLLDVGTQALKSLTVQPLTDGLDEYNLKLNSIKTIQANTGLTGSEGIARINGVLSELNDYADKTIYNFAEMTRNIGTFTAAGVGLEESATAIQGIANLAAMSGSNSQQASTAMYQLSQALASGTVKLMDWNSVVNAGMGGTKFQNMLIETSRVLDTGADKYIEAEGSFRESLKGNWLTSEVLTKTLRNLTMSNEELTDSYRQTLLQEGYNEEQIASILETAKLANEAATKVKSFSQLIDTTKEALGSGWAETWEYIQGDIGQAENLWTTVSDGLNEIIGGFDKTRNDFFRAWNTGEIREFLDGKYVSKQVEGVTSGWTSLFNSLQNIAGLIGDIVSPITEAFESVFQLGEGAQNLGIEAARLTNQFERFTAQLRTSFQESAIGQAIVFGLKTAFTALFSIIKGIGMVAGGILFAAFTVITKALELASGAIEFFVSGIRTAFEFIKGLNVASVMDPIKKFFTETFNVPELAEIIGTLQQLFDAFMDFVTGAGAVKELAEGEVSENSALNRIRQLSDLLHDNFATLMKRAGEALSHFAHGVSDVAGAAASGVFDGLVWAFEQLSKVWSKVQPVLDSIRQKLSTFWSNVVTAFQNSGFSIDPFLEMFKGIGKSFSDFIIDVIDNGFSFDKILELFGRIKDAAGTLFGDIGGSLGNFISSMGGVGNPLEAIITSVQNAQGPFETMDRAVTNIQSTFDKLSNVKLPWLQDSNTEETVKAVDGVSNFAKAIETVSGALKNPIKTIGNFTGNILKGFIDGVDQFIKSIDPEKVSVFVSKIAQLGATGGVIAGLYEFLKFVESASGFITAMKDVPKALTNLVNGLTGIANTIKDNIKVQMFKEVAISIAILVGSLFVLALIPIDKLQQVIPYLAAIAAGIVVAMIAFGKLGAMKSFSTAALSAFALSSLQFALAIASVAAIITALGAIPTEVLKKGAITAGLISAALLGITKALTVIGKSPVPKGMVSSLRSIVGIIASISAVVVVLGLIPHDAIVQGMVTVTLLSVIIVGILLLLAKTNGMKLSASLSGFQGLALSILAIAGAIAGLAVLSSMGADIGTAVRAIVDIMITLGVFTALVSKAKPTQFKEVAITMLAMTGAILLLAGAVAGLALVSLMGGDLTAATGAIAALIGVMTLATFLIGMVGPKLAGVDKTIISFAVVIGVLAAAIIAFSFVPVEDLRQGVIVIAIAIGLLAVAALALGAIGTYFEVGFYALAVFAAGIGVAAIGIGAGCLMIATSLAILATQGPEAAQSFIEALKVLGQGLWDAKEEIALGIAGIVMGIISGLLMCIPGVTYVMLEAMSAMAITIIAAIPMLITAAVIAVIALINGLADALETYGPQLEAAIGHLFEVIINAVHNKIIGALDEFNAFLYNTTGGLMGVEPQAKEAGEKTAKGYAEGVESGKDDVDAATQELNEQLKQKLNQAKHDVGDQASHLFDGAGISTEGLDLSSLETLAPELNDMLKQQGYEGLDGLYDGASMRLQEGGDTSPEDWVKSLFGNGDFSASADAVTDQKAAETIALWDQNVAEHAAESNAGATVASSLDTEGMRANLINSVTNMAVGATNAFNGMFKIDVAPPIQDGTTALTAAAPVFGTESQAAGQAGTTGVEAGLAGFVDKVRSKTDGAVSALSSTGGRMYASGYSVGAQAGNGLIAGMNSALGRVQAKASELAQAASAAISKSLEVKSPSRVTTRIGEYVGEGLVIGMDHMIGNVQSSASGIGSAVIMEIMTQASMIADAVDKLEADPVITPVIDTSMVESGISYISDLISQSQAMSISAIDFGVGNMLHPMDAQASLQPAGPVYNLYIDGAIVNSTPEIQRVIYDTFEVVSMYGGMNHGD